MKDFDRLINECKQELDALHIPYDKDAVFSINTRAKSRWGQCKKKPGEPCSINISSRLLDDDVTDEAAKTTILHELLHSCPDGGSHTGAWKRYATLVNHAYGYDIKRCTSYEEKGIVPVEKGIHYKYVYKCKKCGQMIYRQRKSNFTKHHKRYRCRLCGEKFKRIKQED